MKNTDICALALAWHRAGAGVALATVMRCWGSAPRRPGSQMVIARDGSFAGSVSGGCVEAEVITAAVAAIAAGQPRILRFSVSDDDAFAAGLSCGGSIEVLVEPVAAAAPALPEQLLADLVAARTARQPVVLRTVLARWERSLEPAEAGMREAVTEDGVLRVPHLPPARLLIVGAVHIAQALAPMARLAGMAVTLIDPRPGFATPARFPGSKLICDWPDRVLPGLKPDPGTALVVLAHDPKIDDPAIRAGLAAATGYIGCLGSRRSHAARLDRLALDAAAAARLRAPIGLPIGARTPPEIAVAILAEIIADRARAVPEPAPGG